MPFPDWKVVDEYRYPVETNSLSANFAAVFPEVASQSEANVPHVVHRWQDELFKYQFVI